jgi:hypothetical protein
MRLLFAIGMGLTLTGALGGLAFAEPGARGFTQALPPAAAATPTIESVSRQAQQEIRACDDAVAFQCVANALTRYAAALRQIAHDRPNRPAP